MTASLCSPWPDAAVATLRPRASKSSRWTGSPTLERSRRATGRTGSAYRWRVSTTLPRKPSCARDSPRRASRPLWSPTGRCGWGFYQCSADLEDELIRALGVAAVEAVIEAAGEARSLQLLAGMPAQRDWTREAVLRRFIGARSGRKARYAALLADALEPGQEPEPLAAVLARV